MCDAPVDFADVDPVTGNVTLDTIKVAVAAAQFKVKVIALVHLGGRPCEDIEDIKAFAHSINAFLVEDACHAPLAAYSDKQGHSYKVGSCAHTQAATLSFHAIKHITTGEGGALLTNDDCLASSARLFRSHGIIRDPTRMQNTSDAEAPWYYEMHELGYNYRLSEINGALAINQIKRLQNNINRRQKIAELYHSHLFDLDCVSLPSIPDPAMGMHAWHLFAPSFDFNALGKSRTEVMTELANHGVGSQVHYIPLYRQPFYRSEKPLEFYKGAEAYYQNTLSLPIYFGLSDDDVGDISDCIRQVVNH